jgi:hypothetical protein
MKTLKELNEELEVLYATVNDENEDTPELLSEQERLLNAIIAAEAADLTALSAKALIAHFGKRAPGEPLAKGLSKAQLIAKIEQLPPLRHRRLRPTRRPHPLSSPRRSALPHTPPRMASTGASCARNCALRASKLRTASLMSRKWWGNEALHPDDRQHPGHSYLGCRV